MLQETTAPAAGAGNAQALTQMGFANLIEHMTVVNWIVFIVLVIGVIVSWIWQKSRPDLYSRIGSTIYDDRTEALTDMTKIAPVT